MGTSARLMPMLSAARSMVSMFFSDVSSVCDRPFANGKCCGNRAFMNAYHGSHIMNIVPRTYLA